MESTTRPAPIKITTGIVSVIQEKSFTATAGRFILSGMIAHAVNQEGREIAFERV